MDNDAHPDQVIIRPDGPHYRIEIQLSTRPESVSYTVPRRAAGLRLMVCDIDDDDDDDLILFSGTSPDLLGLWLNDDASHCRFERVYDPPSGPAIGNTPRTGYRHGPGREVPGVIDSNHRRVFDRSTPYFLPARLGPEDSGPPTSTRIAFRILSYARQGRSPPHLRASIIPL